MPVAAGAHKEGRRTGEHSRAATRGCEEGLHHVPPLQRELRCDEVRRVHARGDEGSPEAHPGGDYVQHLLSDVRYGMMCSGRMPVECRYRPARGRWPDLSETRTSGATENSTASRLNKYIPSTHGRRPRDGCGYLEPCPLTPQPRRKGRRVELSHYNLCSYSDDKSQAGVLVPDTPGSNTSRNPDRWQCSGLPGRRGMYLGFRGVLEIITKEEPRDQP